MRRGFTLIELLAVIVIIAIISLIAYPTITGIVERTKKEAFKESVNNLISAGENYIIKYSADHQGEGLTYPVTFICNGESCINSNNDKLPFKGKAPSDGNLIIRGEKDIYAEYISDGKYCVVGTKGNLQIYTNCDDIDVTKPIVEITNDKYILNIKIIDASGAGDYCVTLTNDVNTCSWISNTSNSVKYNATKEATYYIFVKDTHDNIGAASFVLGANAHIGEENIISYTGDVQEWQAPYKGLYKFDLYGAQGGNSGKYVGGLGGHSSGYILMNQNDKLYLVVGGQNGYNGGGNASTQKDNNGTFTGATGGGATHISTTNRGELKNYISYQNEILIVSGGGGGAASGPKSDTNGNGGTGGGLTGGSGTGASGAGRASGTGGTQTTGGTSGATSYSSFTAPTFGQGCMPNSTYTSYMRVAGGGGWYGGGCGIHSGGGGGSSYIGGVPEITYNGNTYTPSTENGVQEENGKIIITYVAG